MKETLENLWNDYLLDASATMDSDEERELAKKAIELHQSVITLLNTEQIDAVEKYVDILLQIDSLFTKRAFMTGCEFAVSFLLESGDFYKKPKTNHQKGKTI